MSFIYCNVQFIKKKIKKSNENIDGLRDLGTRRPSYDYDNSP